MPLTPIGIVEIPHRAFSISRAAESFVFAVASMDTDLALFGRDLVASPVGRNWQKIRSISLNSTGDLLAVSHGDNLTIVERSGSLLFWLNEGFHDCFFDPHNDFLWCVALLSPEQVSVQCREPTNWSVVQEVVIDDPYWGSSWSLHSVPKANTLALWAAAGQDGQQVYWLTRNGGLRCTLEPALQITTPPDFSTNGDEFLVLDDDGVIHRFRFADVHEVGWCRWPFADEDDGFGTSIAYIDDRRALLSSNNGRLFLLDLTTMTVLRETTITNHLPRPSEELFPSLVGDQTLCTDMLYFSDFDDMIVSVHKRDGGWEPENWRDSLLLFPKESFGE